MRIRFAWLGWLALLICQACSVTLTEQVPASELDFTERSAFTSDGRLFVIGIRPNATSWIVEVVAEGGKYTTKNIAAGTLEGTADGRIGGAPLGDACQFGGMKTFGMRIYGGCVDAATGRTSLVEVDLTEGTVRAGYLTTCNNTPSAAPCEYTEIFTNGMGIDAQGRIYVTNTLAHLTLLSDMPSLSFEGTGTIEQIVVDSQASSGRNLVFTHRPWFSADFFQDGGAPNGVQIEGNVLYYAAGPNINRVDITPSGDAGAAVVHYAGPSLSYIDDFAVLDGRMALARTIPPALVALDRAEPFGTARELGTRDMSITQIPSSIAFQADNPAGHPVFPANSLVVTCFFGGGIYALTGIEP